MKVCFVDAACKGYLKSDWRTSASLVIADTTDKIVLEEYQVVTLGHITSQAAEIMAMTLGFKKLLELNETEVPIFTDSQYVYNTIFFDKVRNYKANFWLTKSNEQVPNRHLLEEMDEAYQACHMPDIFHVKAHIMPLGEIGARKLLLRDTSGESLLRFIENKLYTSEYYKQYINDLQETSLKINGAEMTEDTAAKAIILNTLVDTIASVRLEV